MSKCAGGADVAIDYHLVTVDNKLKLERLGMPPKETPRFDASMSKDPTIKEELTLQFWNRHEVNGKDIDKNWENVAEAYDYNKSVILTNTDPKPSSE